MLLGVTYHAQKRIAAARALAVFVPRLYRVYRVRASAHAHMLHRASYREVWPSPGVGATLTLVFDPKQYGVIFADSSPPSPREGTVKSAPRATSMAAKRRNPMVPCRVLKSTGLDCDCTALQLVNSSSLRRSTSSPLSILIKLISELRAQAAGHTTSYSGMRAAQPAGWARTQTTH